MEQQQQHINHVNMPTEGKVRPTHTQITSTGVTSLPFAPVRSRPPIMLKPVVSNQLEPSLRSAEQDLERKKNEIVQNMLQRLRPFIGPTGHLRVDTDFGAFSELMKGESHYIQRTLLLTVLLSASALPEGGEIFKAIGSNDRLLSVTTEWLGESIKEDSPLTGKLLNLLDKLPLTLDQLVEHRLGKLVKKLMTSTSAKQEVRDRAGLLCDAWTKLARQEDFRRRASSDSSSTNKFNVGSERRKGESASSNITGNMTTTSTSTTSTTTGTSLITASSDATTVFPKVQAATAVANMTLFNDDVGDYDASTTAAAVAATAVHSHNHQQPPVKTRAEQILERVARGETSASKVATRPLSADDIRKEKKRQLYLQEAIGVVKKGDHTDESMNFNSNTFDMEQSEPKRKKKRVSFAGDADLVQMHYFDPPSDEGECEHHYNNVHEMEKNEASFAFKQMALVMEAESDWSLPKFLDIPKDLRFEHGVNSVEKQVQEARELKALSAVYFSLDDVPPSPTECLPEQQTEENTKRIPLRDAEGKIPTITRYVNSPPNHSQHHYHHLSPLQQQSGASSADSLLCSLLQDPNALQTLLKNVPPPSLAPSHSHNRQEVPYPPSSASSARRTATNLPVYNPTPRLSHMHPMPFIPPAPMAIPMGFPPPVSHNIPVPGSYPNVHPPQQHHSQINTQGSLPPNVRHPKYRTVPCKYYRLGDPNSCRYGDTCQFYHAGQ